MITDYEDKQATILCPVCETETTVDISESESNYDEDWNEYSQLVIQCGTCVDSTTVVNMNIPEIYDKDIIAMEELAPEADRIQREHIRNIMWDIRSDLKDLNRSEYETNYAVENKTEIKTIRENINEDS